MASQTEAGKAFEYSLIKNIREITPNEFNINLIGQPQNLYSHHLDW